MYHIEFQKVFQKTFFLVCLLRKLWRARKVLAQFHQVMKKWINFSQKQNFSLDTFEGIAKFTFCLINAYVILLL